MGNEGSHSTQERGQGEGRLENDLRVRWRRIDRPEGPLNGRECHCAAAASNDLLYIFGGIVAANGDYAESNDLLVFNPDTESWKVADVKGDVPPPRTSASLAAVGDKLYLFGGLSQAGGWTNSVFMFDTVTSTWSHLNVSGSGPSPRDKLATASIGRRIYVFGGFGPKSTSKGNEDDAELEEDDEEEDESDGENNGLEETQKAAKFGWFDDLFVFDTDSLSWSQPMHLNKEGPTSRAAHAMCATSNHLVIFGGRDAVGRNNDLYIYDTESRKWVHELQVTGLRPEPRSFHTACVVGHRVIVIGGRGVNNQHFGDVHVLDTETWQWLQPAIEGDLLTPRGVHTAAVVRNRLVVFGGSRDFDAETMQCETYLGDTYVLDTDDLLKGKASPTESAPQKELGNPSTSVQKKNSTSS